MCNNKSLFWKEKNVIIATVNGTDDYKEMFSIYEYIIKGIEPLTDGYNSKIMQLFQELMR